MDVLSFDGWLLVTPQRGRHPKQRVNAWKDVWIALSYTTGWVTGKASSLQKFPFLLHLFPLIYIQGPGRTWIKHWKKLLAGYR